MRLALIIFLSVSLLAFVLFYFTVDEPTSSGPVSMPWQVTVHDPERSEVFGIVLNETNLEQAKQQIGQLEGVALYQNPQGQFSLEAYFGKINMGPFSARLIANLLAPQQELKKLTEFAVKRSKTDDGSHKWILNPEKVTEQGGRKIQSLTYIPVYSGIDQGFILQRFGDPQRRKKLDENTELWFYPELGLRIMVDSDGKEMFEYTAPAQFQSILGSN